MCSARSGIVLLLLAVISALAACGQTGDLCLPDDKQTERSDKGKAGQN